MKELHYIKSEEYARHIDGNTRALPKLPEIVVKDVFENSIPLSTKIGNLELYEQILPFEVMLQVKEWFDVDHPVETITIEMMETLIFENDPNGEKKQKFLDRFQLELDRVKLDRGIRAELEDSIRKQDLPPEAIEAKIKALTRQETIVDRYNIFSVNFESKVLTSSMQILSFLQGDQENPFRHEARALTDGFSDDIQIARWKHIERDSVTGQEHLMNNAQGEYDSMPNKHVIRELSKEILGDDYNLVSYQLFRLMGAMAARKQQGKYKEVSELDENTLIKADEVRVGYALLKLTKILLALAPATALTGNKTEVIEVQSIEELDEQVENIMKSVKTAEESGQRGELPYKDVVLKDSLEVRQEIQKLVNEIIQPLDFSKIPLYDDQCLRLYMGGHYYEIWKSHPNAFKAALERQVKARELMEKANINAGGNKDSVNTRDASTINIPLPKKNLEDNLFLKIYVDGKQINRWEALENRILAPLKEYVEKGGVDDPKVIRQLQHLHQGNYHMRSTWKTEVIAKKEDFIAKLIKECDLSPKDAEEAVEKCTKNAKLFYYDVDEGKTIVINSSDYTSSTK